MGTTFKVAAMLALAATGAAMPAQAQNRCWADREVSAAHVRQMQTMLMVAALRCRAAGIDMTADYDAFVSAQKAAITAANTLIKQHFADAGGNQADYDRFVTALANGYGDDATSQGSCADAAALAHEGAAAAQPAALEGVAEARIFPASLPGGSCAAPARAVTLALADTKPAPASLPPIVRIAAPVTPSAAISLPADVVAAMAVLARYQTAQAAAGPAAAPMQLATIAH